MTGKAPPDRTYPRRDRSRSRARPPGSATSAGRRCGGGTLTQSFIESCNATFARLGYEMGQDFVPVMNECGVGSDVVPIAPPLDLDPGAVGSIGPGAGAEAPRFALAGIGQGDVFTTPLEMALVAAGVANGGVIMEPHVAKQITNADGKVIQTIEAKPWKTCMDPATAGAVTAMMVENVERGTATRGADRQRGRRRRRRVPRRPVSRDRHHTRGSSPLHRPTIRGSPCRCSSRTAATTATTRPEARTPRRSPGRCSSRCWGSHDSFCPNPSHLDCLDDGQRRARLREPLRAADPGGTRRDGRRLPGARPAAEPAGRGEGALTDVRGRPDVRGAVPSRGAGGREPEPPEHRRGVRLGPRGRHVLHRDGVRQRADAPRPGQQVPHAAADGGGPHRSRHRRRARVRPPQRRHPPRREARERAHHARGRGEGHRLRHRRGPRAATRSPRPARCSARPPTSHRSRRRDSRSTDAPTCTRSASCSTRCSPAWRPSPPTARCRSRTSTCARSRCRRRASSPASRARSIASCSPR